MYRDISTDCKHAQTLIFNGLARHENQVLPTRDTYRDCSVAGRTNTGVIPVSSEQPDLDASVVGRTDTGVIPVYSEKHDVDVSVASKTDTGVISVYSEQPHASNQDDTLNNQEVKEDAVTVSSISLEKRNTYLKLERLMNQIMVQYN